MNSYDVSEMPTAQDIHDAMCMDEFVRELNQEHEAEVDAIASAVEARLDRLAVGGPKQVKPYRPRTAGFTLVEIVVAIFIVGIIAAVLVPKLINPKEAATASRCAANMNAIAADLEGYWEQARRYPTVAEYRSDEGGRYEMLKVGGIYYLVDGDLNKGHGNDIDECDEENPGKSGAKRDCLDIRWVLVCGHNHGEVADYIYRTDRGVPTMVLDGRAEPKGSLPLAFVQEAPNDYPRFIALQWKDR